MPRTLNYEMMFHPMNIVFSNKKMQKIFCVIKKVVWNRTASNRKFHREKNFSAEVFNASEQKCSLE